MMKHSLAEHLDSVKDWHSFHVRDAYQPDNRHQTCLIIAYERWINDRPLLMDEDPDYERVEEGFPDHKVVYRRTWPPGRV